MQPTMTNGLNTDPAADAPITRDELIEQAYLGLMSLTPAERKKVLSKYAKQEY